MEKIKNAVSYIGGLVILVLAALLFRQKKVADNLESELTQEKTTTEITLNEQARDNARDIADKLLDNYEKLKRSDD